MDSLQTLAQYYSEQLSYYSDKDYFEVLKFKTEFFGIYKFVKRLFPQDRYRLTDYYATVEKELEMLLVEKNTEKLT